MNCIYAVLFLAGENALMTDRLVLLYHHENPFYGVYRPHPETLFPSPSPQHNLIISANKVTGPGTYNTLYCSLTLENPMIKDIISQGLTTLSDKEVLPLDKGDYKLDKCQRQIITLSRQAIHSRPKTLNQLLKLKKCTVSHVITLAHEGKIFLNGYNNFNAPKPAQGTFSLDIDWELPVKSIVSSDDFMYSPTENTGLVLAWIQGQLHVFKRDSIWRRWIQYTKIGAEVENVATIIPALLAMNLAYFRATIATNGNDIKSEINQPITSEINFAGAEWKSPLVDVLVSKTLKGSLPAYHISRETRFTLSHDTFETFPHSMSGVLS
ncbi:BgTH12-02632 [Blumeria graminis f. sp. triticale]|uniref:Bgt-51918 n=2 Tax=Blumeria graminis TaxID=34373 RepID=A0A9X9MJ10_BLUGR|nr:BgTH12-02632 [Blumeria graminis f. sp. triticale]VDB88839.1 Bgt-51918 [Blumeria graminis f. sp. tritici]